MELVHISHLFGWKWKRIQAQWMGVPHWATWLVHSSVCFHANSDTGYTLIEKYAETFVKCGKPKMYSGIFRITFFAVRTTFFAPVLAFAQKFKGFHGLFFFAALMKHEIRMKYEKCLVSVSYFVVCFAKTHAKYPWHVKYEKCKVGLINSILQLFASFHSHWMRGLNDKSIPSRRQLERRSQTLQESNCWSLKTNRACRTQSNVWET